MAAVPPSGGEAAIGGAQVEEVEGEDSVEEAVEAAATGEGGAEEEGAGEEGTGEGGVEGGEGEEGGAEAGAV